MFPTKNIDIKPSSPLPSGRYLLDEDGRLHPERYHAFILSVAAVVVKLKPLPIDTITAPAAVIGKGVIPESQQTVPSEGRRALGKKKDPKSYRVPRIVPDDADIVRKAKKEPVTRAQAIQVAAKIDTKAYAAAARARAAAPKPAPAVTAPIYHAKSPDPCRKCGANGYRGCEHQLPFQGYDTPASRTE